MKEIDDVVWLDGGLRQHMADVVNALVTADPEIRAEILGKKFHANEINMFDQWDAFSQWNAFDQFQASVIDKTCEASRQ
jgi:hypothetical protein